MEKQKLDFKRVYGGKSSITQCKRMSRQCLKSLALSITSVSMFVGSLSTLNVSDRISLLRGFIYTSLGFLHFISLNDFLNKFVAGIRGYNLLKSDALDIANKFVSAVQATYSCLAGFIVCRSSCNRGFLSASHFMSESYAWFGAAYFFYDLWSMYKVHVAKVADKLFLIKLKAAAKETLGNNVNGHQYATFYDDVSQIGSNGNGHSLMDASELDNEANLKYKEICDGYENEIQVVEGQPNFFQYLKSEPLMVGHHIFIGSFGLSVIAFLRGGLGDCIFSTIYLMEASTPFVSFRSILSTMGLKDHRAYLINCLIMMATFFIFRILLLPYLFVWYAGVINKPLLAAIATLPRGCKISIGILFLPQYYPL